MSSLLFVRSPPCASRAVGISGGAGLAGAAKRWSAAPMGRNCAATEALEGPSRRLPSFLDGVDDAHGDARHRDGLCRCKRL